MSVAVGFLIREFFFLSHIRLSKRLTSIWTLQTEQNNTFHLNWNASISLALNSYIHFKCIFLCRVSNSKIHHASASVFIGTPLQHSRVLFGVCLYSTDFNWNGNSHWNHTWENCMDFSVGRNVFFFLSFFKKSNCEQFGAQWSSWNKKSQCNESNSALKEMASSNFMQSSIYIHIFRICCMCVCVSCSFRLFCYWCIKTTARIGRKMFTPIIRSFCLKHRTALEEQTAAK